ncbi:hypothetical protein ACERIT_10120 [Halopenitus sp. H-Gu1]|uniref:hypothetical protein n=1 Tax=Halopenitus sp. H-Gu1 TaxID=3242697 RepID=UPI00359DA974
MAREVGGLADALEKRKAAEDTVRWINRTDESEETNREYRQCLRAFGRRALGVDELPEYLNGVPAGYSSNYDPSPDPAKMFRWDEHVEQTQQSEQAADESDGESVGEILDHPIVSTLSASSTILR